MFKRTAIAALVLGFSGAASAAMYAPAPAPSCAAGNVTVPCERSAWDLGVDALYMRSDSNPYANSAGFRARYGWGYRVEGSYHFGTGNDVTVSWAHNKRSTDASAFVTGAGTLSNTLDVVNFELAQLVNFGENVSARFQGGVQYVSIKNEDPSATITSVKTTGFGPRAGVMTKYDFGNGFGVYGDFNTAMLVGKRKLSTNTNNTYGTMLSTDASVGVAYTHSMAQGDLTTRLSWGVRQFNVNSNVNGWDGITLGLKWVGNA